MTLALLERAIRSQFVLLHRYEGESEWEWEQRRNKSHRLSTDRVECPHRTAALIVFCGLLEEFRLDQDDACAYLELDDRTVSIYISKWEKYYAYSDMLVKSRIKLNPYKLETKIYFKTFMVRRWLKQFSL